MSKLNLEDVVQLLAEDDNLSAYTRLVLSRMLKPPLFDHQSASETSEAASDSGLSPALSEMMGVRS